jgi:hypothetical protein
MPEHFRVQFRLRSWCRIALLVLAIGSLTASLATRFTVQGPEVEKVTAAKAQTSEAKRQHLLGSASQWTEPASTFTLFQPPRTSVLAVSVVVPSANLTSESWLYNRPPPAL